MNHEGRTEWRSRVRMSMGSVSERFRSPGLAVGMGEYGAAGTGGRVMERGTAGPMYVNT